MQLTIFKFYSLQLRVFYFNDLFTFYTTFQGGNMHLLYLSESLKLVLDQSSDATFEGMKKNLLLVFKDW